MTWTLIIWFWMFGGSASGTSVPGFSSEASCQEAAVSVKAERKIGVTGTLCVRVK